MSDNAPLSAGAAVIEVTPDLAMINGRFKKPYRDLLEPLFARALVLGDGGCKVALVCWDLIGAREDAVADLRRAVREATDIPEAHILVNSSHSHSAPSYPSPRAAATTGPGARPDPTEDPAYREWASRFPGVIADVVLQADAARRPCTLGVGYATVAEWLFNRRPRTPEGAVTTMFVPKDPCALPDGLRFRPVDPVATVLTFREASGDAVATLFSAACHGVSIYHHYQGLSSDWPGATVANIAAALGGEALFLQGCCGNVVPARRGIEARNAMARLVADRVVAAARQSRDLPPAPLACASAHVGLPLNERGRSRAGTLTATAEIQAITCGPLAIVTIPGEPLIELSLEIRERSPFPHTIVAGYSNGGGVGYVGMPGEFARGGYESGAGRGADEAGRILVETAVRLLREQRAARG
ncbi:MAG: hypothetical protein HY321_18845 [Armatimonadetes bacterium]|nr:hypothetical protein [Armatimonadota bacterium]